MSECQSKRTDLQMSPPKNHSLFTTKSSCPGPCTWRTLFPECLSQLLPNSSLPFKIQLKFLPPPERLLWVSIIPRNPKVCRGQTNAPLNKDVHTLIFKACRYTPLCGKINLAGMTKWRVLRWKIMQDYPVSLYKKEAGVRARDETMKQES